MTNGIFHPPTPRNEPVRAYEPGAPERDRLKNELARMSNEVIDIPLIIGGKEIRTGQIKHAVMPHNHGHVLASYHQGGPEHVEMAATAAREAWLEWSEMGWEDRSAVFLKAAELLASHYRDKLNGSTMLGQSKTVFQAEIDSACELIDFFRFNVHYLRQILQEQPMVSPADQWNRSEYRALEGFIFAVTPFNFTSIAANLCFTPALMGNAVIWKPSDTAVYSGYHIMQLFEAAGLPPGVINFVPGPPQEIGQAALNRPDLAGIHFTGSTRTFQYLWRAVGERIENYHAYPRLVGETGGKDFIFAHESADIHSLQNAILRGAFEFQGQKCSAASRAYIPQQLWDQIKPSLIEEVNTISMGDIADFRHFMGAVIDQRSFDKIKSYIDHARNAADAKIICGGETDDSHGFFISPTVIETTNPKFKTMCEEIFGPVMTIMPYEASRYDEMIEVCDKGSPYALTGAIFGHDRRVIAHLTKALRHAAGNFYINDKPTGAVVGQQPFGGGRASGTNDKAGSIWNLLRWTNARSIKENFVPPTEYRYPHMSEP